MAFSRGIYFIVFVSQFLVIFSHEHFSDLQILTHAKTMYKCGDKPMTFGELTQEQEKQNIISYLDCFKNQELHDIMPNITTEKLNEFNEVIRQMKSSHWRLKRQTGMLFRRREEVRAMHPWRWRQVTSRFVSLHRRGIMRRIVGLHTGNIAVLGAHGGPAFLSWHRVLLLLIEFYLGVPMPYWDSSIDFHAGQPTMSLLWTPYFFGNGDGSVRTGPFRFFREPNGNPIRRNIGGDGSLYARENIASILERGSNTELVYPSGGRISFEAYHGATHVWVGGSMLSIANSPSDPCFFFHHCFVDKLWADAQARMAPRVRERYPYRVRNPNTITRQERLHRPGARMVNFRLSITNRGGYSSSVSRRAIYARSPGEARSPLQCINRSWPRRVLVWNATTGICVAGTGNRRDFLVPPERPQARQRLFASDINEPKFETPIRDSRTFAGQQQIAALSGMQSDFNVDFTTPLRDVRTSRGQRMLGFGNLRLGMIPLEPVIHTNHIPIGSLTLST